MTWGDKRVHHYIMESCQHHNHVSSRCRMQRQEWWWKHGGMTTPPQLFEIFIVSLFRSRKNQSLYLSLKLFKDLLHHPSLKCCLSTFSGGHCVPPTEAWCKSTNKNIIWWKIVLQVRSDFMELSCTFSDADSKCMNGVSSCQYVIDLELSSSTTQTR